MQMRSWGDQAAIQNWILTTDYRHVDMHVDVFQLNFRFSFCFKRSNDADFFYVAGFSLEVYGFDCERYSSSYDKSQTTFIDTVCPIQWLASNICF